MNFKKVSVYSILLIVATLFLPNLTLAGNTPAAGVTVDNMSETVAAKAISEFRQATTDIDKLAKLKIAGGNLVVARLNTLNKLVTVITAADVDASLKSNLITATQSQISQLTTVKSTISDETSLDNLKSDVKSIYNGHFVYALFIPEIHGQVAADRMSNVVDSLSGLEPKIESYLAELKSSGVDTAKGDASYADYKAELSSAKNSIQSANMKFQSIDLTQFAAAKQDLDSGITSLNSAKSALASAKIDLQTITALSK